MRKRKSWEPSPLWSRIVPDGSKPIRFYPDIRGARPRKWFWLAYFIPQVTLWAREIHIGFDRVHGREFHPVMSGRFLRITRFGVSWGRA